MTMITGTSGVRRAGVLVASRLARRHDAALLAAIAGAWCIVAVAQATGNAAALHHHALIEGGPPLWLAIPVFLAGWQVMVAAMMLPASVPAVRMFEDAAQAVPRPGRAVALFLAGYATAWTAFGLLAFIGDLGLHRLADGMPWLAQRPWLVQAGILGLAGAFQFTPLKQRGLTACRDPRDHVARAPALAQGAARLGLRHGLACLGSSWALMLVMFAEGFASPVSMVILTGLMTYEVTGRRGLDSVAPAGILLVLAALATLSGGGLAA